MLVETSNDPEIKKARASSKERYNKVIQEFNRPFPNHFNTELIEPNFDEEDRTIRCTNCFWEIQANDTVCPHCDCPLGHFDYLSGMSNFEDDDEDEDDEDERDLDLDEYEASWDDFVVDDDEEIELDADDTWNSFEGFGSPAGHPDGPVSMLDSINEHSDTDDYMHGGSFDDYFERILPRVRQNYSLGDGRIWNRPIPRNMGFVSASQIMERDSEGSSWRDRNSSARDGGSVAIRQELSTDRRPQRESINFNQRRDLRRRARTIESSDDEEEGTTDNVHNESGLLCPRNGVGQSTSERQSDSGSQNLQPPVAAVDTDSLNSKDSAESSLQIPDSVLDHPSTLQIPDSVLNHPSSSTVCQLHEQSPQPQSDNSVGSNDSSPFLKDNQSVHNEMGGLPYPLLQSLSLWENHYSDAPGTASTMKEP